MMKPRNLISALISLALGLYLLQGCGIERQYEDYPQIRAGRLELTQANHPHGWGQSQCFFCHVKANIHQRDTTGAVGPAEQARAAVEARGVNSCIDCHEGDTPFNGITGGSP